MASTRASYPRARVIFFVGAGYAAAFLVTYIAAHWLDVLIFMARTGLPARDF